MPKITKASDQLGWLMRGQSPALKAYDDAAVMENSKGSDPRYDAADKMFWMKAANSGLDPSILRVIMGLYRSGVINSSMSHQDENR